MSNRFNNIKNTSDNEENEKNTSENENENEFEYEISIYASDKPNFSQIQEIKRIKNPNEIGSLQIRLSKLQNLKGLNTFTNLTHLDLSNNQLTSVKNSLYYLQKLSYLNLSCNKISSLEGIEDLENLTELNVSHNKISSLETFSRFITKKKLRILNIKGNLILELKQFDYLTGFTALSTLILSEGNDTNPVCQNANCNEYIEGVLSGVESVRANKTANNFALPNLTALNISKINHKNFLNNTMNKKFSNIENYKEEIKNYQYNIQDIYRDQKNLILKYEQEKTKYNLQISELQEENSKLYNENKSLKTKIENLETSYKDLKYKNADLFQENSNAKQTRHDKEIEISDLTIKLAQIKKDYELTLIEKNKLIALNKDISSEISTLKDQIRDLKNGQEKSENTYKDLLNKKSDEINERIRSISSLETKIYEYGKTVSDKQKEIANLIENNTTLQQNVIKLNKEKSEIEFVMSKKLDAELTEANERYKKSIDEIEKKYNSTINAKSEECLNDIKALEKHYESLLSEVSDKLKDKEKENEKISFSLSECKTLLKETLEKEEKNTNDISSYKQKNIALENELNQSIKNENNLKMELQDIHNLNLKLQEKIDKMTTELSEKEKILSSINQELKVINKQINEKDDCINDLLGQIQNLKNQPDIEELNEIIKTKTMLSDDQANQIIDLNKKIEEIANSNEKLNSKIGNYKKKIENLSNEISEKDNRIGENENKIAQYENEIVEYENQIKNKENLIELIQKELNEIKDIINEDKTKIDNQNKEITKLNETIEEFKILIITQKDQNKEIISDFDKYKAECERQLQYYKKENEEMKNEMKFLITEYEKVQAQNEKYQAKFIQFTQMMNGFN